MGRVQQSIETGVIAVNDSRNAKVGTASATYVSKKTCPASCPFLSKCLADDGHMNIHTQRLAQTESSPIEIAEAEAKAITRLDGYRPLRLHVVGDCPTDEAAKLVSDACAIHTAKEGQPAWTYTHAWHPAREGVKRESWGSVSVLASCETLDEVATAKEAGYATALVVEKFEEKKAYAKNGHTIMPCPQQVQGKKVTCLSCKLCLKDQTLKKNGITIAFEAHGSGSKKFVKEAVRSKQCG